MPNLIDPLEEQLQLLEASPRIISLEMLSLADAIIRDDFQDGQEALNSLSESIALTMTFADLLGRKRALMWFDSYSRREQPSIFRNGFVTIKFVKREVPKVRFEEAIRDIALREPRLAKTAESVSRLYQTQHAFALAKSSSLSLTKRIKDMVENFIRKGKPVPKASEQIAEVGGFTEAYAETVYRTNLATAYTAGQMEQVQDPDISSVIQAFEFESILDSDARENHAAAHGLLAATNDPIWEVYSPPLGYNCRCALRPVDRFELERRNLLSGKTLVKRSFPVTFSKAYPDPNFGKNFSARRRIYGG